MPRVKRIERRVLLDRRKWVDKRILTKSEGVGRLEHRTGYHESYGKDEKVYFYPFGEHLGDNRYSFIVEDKENFLCGLCGEWKDKKFISAHELESEGEEKGIKICRKCLVAGKMLTTIADEERQSRAIEMNYTIATDAELGMMYYSRVLKNVVRFDPEDHLYILCKTCYVWKPRSTYFFPKILQKPRKMFQLERVCLRCLIYTDKRKKYLIKAKKKKEEEEKSIGSIHRDLEILYVLFRVFPNQPSRRDFIAMYETKQDSMRALKVLGRRYDAGFESQGYTKMFIVEPTHIKTNSNRRR